MGVFTTQALVLTVTDLLTSAIRPYCQGESAATSGMQVRTLVIAKRTTVQNRVIPQSLEAPQVAVKARASVEGGLCPARRSLYTCHTVPLKRSKSCNTGSRPHRLCRQVCHRIPARRHLATDSVPRYQGVNRFAQAKKSVG